MFNEDENTTGTEQNDAPAPAPAKPTHQTGQVVPAPKPAAKPAPEKEPDTLAKLRDDFETFKKKVQKHVSYT